MLSRVSSFRNVIVLESVQDKEYQLNVENDKIVLSSGENKVKCKNIQSESGNLTHIPIYVIVVRERNTTLVR